MPFRGHTGIDSVLHDAVPSRIPKEHKLSSTYSRRCGEICGHPRGARPLIAETLAFRTGPSLSRRARSQKMEQVMSTNHVRKTFATALKAAFSHLKMTAV